jgi:hypothetical protein
VLAAAGASAGTIPAKAEQPLPVPQVTATVEPATSEDTWQALEYGSFRVRHQGNRNLAEEVARRAEEHRIVIFQRWSGPPGGTWNPLCEIVLHPSASAFAEATRQPIEATGHAHVKLETGRATERRIDLRVDDDTLLDNALPRELTHIVLGDLFPANAPPRWATDAMAVLATSPTEIERYLRTVPRCEQSGGLIPLGQLLEMKDLPQAEQITAYAVESVSLVDFLVRWKKEKAFTTFLRDCQRYGTASALKRQYGITSPQQLEKLWRENVLTSR